MPRVDKLPEIAKTLWMHYRRTLSRCTKEMKSVATVLRVVATELAKTARGNLLKLRDGEEAVREWVKGNSIFVASLNP